AGAILPALGQVERRIEQLGRFDPRFGAYLEQLRTVKYTLEDLAYFLRDYLQGIDFAPDRLKEVDDRVLELDRLKRKYGATIADVLRAVDEMRAQLAGLSESEERALSITQALAEAKDAYLKVACELSDARREAAGRLEETVMTELGELAMG